MTCIDDKLALAAAIRLLQHGHPSIREGAVWALSRHLWARDTVVAALAQAEQTETDSNVLTAIGVVKAYAY